MVRRMDIVLVLEVLPFENRYKKIISRKRKNRKYQTFGTVTKSNRKIAEIGKIDTTKTHDCLLFWFGTGISIKGGGVTLVRFMDPN